MKLYRVILVALCLVAVGAANLMSQDNAHAGVFPGQVITSAGPLTRIFIADDLGCQVEHTGDADFQFFPSSDEQGNCGTFLLVGATLYGNYGSWGDTEFSPVSQTAVTGSGTSGSPYQVVTVVDAGTTGIRITQTDSYIVGDEFYRTDIQVSNTGNTPTPVKLYRGADCYLGGSDSGYGYLDGVGGVVGCTENANNVPSGRVELWTPITPPTHFQHDNYSTVRSVIESGGNLADTCQCTTNLDNGGAIQWNATIGAGSSSTYSHYTTFSPTGVGAPTPTPGGPTNTPSSGTPTEETRPKTHTPTPVPTDEPTDTAVAGTATRATSTELPLQPPPPGGGNQGGAISPPNTGSGSGGSGPTRVALAGIAMAVIAAGGALFIAGRRLRA